MPLLSIITLTLAATAAICASASPEPIGRDSFYCGFQTNDKHRVISEQFAKEEANHRKDGLVARQDIKVNVYVHILASAKDKSLGFLNDNTIQAQLGVMNQDYAPTGISFTLVGVDRTVHANWSMDQDGDNMRQKLRKGDYRDLNLYFIPGIRIFGYCTLPQMVRPGTQEFFSDGCTIRSDTVPGGGLKDYNLGKTAVHEVGHWFGLFHTFEGGCSDPGDYIGDTPAQGAASTGCPVGKDSCQWLPGLDPIHNYMDYSIDSCYQNFTPEQIQRMHSFWNKFRA
ncbi:Extracellular metalloprotease [Cladobotryum mycophilum]|uniref:Extracellular metalloprotease n=1 Tax=Cladobotryum mycophilum TaxID=491253 RepID=A0ABR0T3I8_9HYPO